MKLRPALLVFAFLLLGSFANASSTATANVPASPANEDAAFIAPAPEGGVVFMTLADESPDCVTEELPFLNPAAGERAAGPCGSCSQQNCRGGQLGQPCGLGKTCQFPYAEFCSAGGPKCYCWGGMLP